MTSGNRPPLLTTAVDRYIALVVAAGGLALAAATAASVRTPNPQAWLALGALSVVATSFRLRFPSVAANISIADTFFLVMVVLFGAGPATLALATGGFLMSFRRGHPWRQIAFNTAAPALSLFTAAHAFLLAAGVAPIGQSHAPVVGLVLPLVLLTAVYFVCNSGFIAVAVALESRQSPFNVWRLHFAWLGISYLAASSVAFCLILVGQQVSLAAVLIVLPLLAVFHLTLRSSFGRLNDAQAHLGALDRLYLSTVETLAMAIDAKDDVTHSHVRRVQAYAVGLAKALHVDTEEQIKAIKAAALLHDTGKLAVPEHILNKPGKLTASEFDKMKLHVDVGADILSLVEFPYPVVPIVRCHHENWDGSGYPRGVRGEDIPIGARILSVVDCFDALTSDRPYRRAMTEEAALDILRERSGTMYDPDVVETFIRVYGDIAVGAGESPEQREVMRRIASSRADTSEPVAAAPSAGASSELLAFVSLARIASGDGGVADVLALSSNLIADLMPEVTGAWYLPDPGRVRLSVCEAFGPAARDLRGRTVLVGERLTGWVAAGRQTIVNSDAALDLEGGAIQPMLRTCMSVPLLAGDTLVGVLSLYSCQTDAFDEDRGRLIQMIAPHVAGAVQAASRNAATAAPAERPAPARELRLVSGR